MDYLRSIAEAHYYAGSEESQQLAHEFFDAMDEDGSGEVDYSEFKEFLREEGYEDYADRDLFKSLDRDGDRGLDFWEVMTLYYIIKSGRPFCFHCEKFLVAVYFACVECFMNSDGPYYLCTACYKDQNYDHSHRNSPNPHFLDNYSLLESHRLGAHDQEEEEEEEEGSESDDSSGYSSSPPQRRSSSSRALVVAPSRRGSGSGSGSGRASRTDSSRYPKTKTALRTAYKAFNMVATAATVGTTVGCSIM